MNASTLHRFPTEIHRWCHGFSSLLLRRVLLGNVMPKRVLLSRMLLRRVLPKTLKHAQQRETT